MGLLDDLKKQAETAKGSEVSKTAIMQSNIGSTDSALTTANKYLATLCNQLNVLKPVSTRVYLLDQVGEIGGLTQTEFFSDYRKGDIEGKDRIRQVLLNFRCTLTKPIQLRRNFDQIDAFRKILARFGLKHTSQVFKNERGVVTHEVFTISGEFLVQTLFEGDHLGGFVKATMKNFTEFGFVSVQFDAREFGETTLDEFTKLIIGKPSNFMKLGKRVPFSGQASLT